MSETLWGVLIGGVIGLLGPLIVQHFEGRRQAARMDAENERRREDFWFERMTGPFLEHRRDCIQQLIQCLCGGETSDAMVARARALAANTPPGVRAAVAEWMVKRGEHPNPDGDSKILQLRYRAARIAGEHLCRAIEADVKARFVDDGDLPWTGDVVSGSERVTTDVTAPSGEIDR